jgi:hypothetical protein
MRLTELVAALAVSALFIDLAAAVAIERRPAAAQAGSVLFRAAWGGTAALVMLVVVRFVTALT